MKSSVWKENKLGELTTYISRGITPKYSENDGIIVLNQKCIRDFNINLEPSRIHNISLKNITDDKYLHTYDILINSTGVGTAGRVAQWMGKSKTATADSHVTIVRPDSQVVEPLYLGYAVKAQQKYIETFAEGSTGQTEINRARLSEEIIIRYPENMRLQREIANILKNIDDKINLNNKLNDNLIEVAYLLFKEWFLNYNDDCIAEEKKNTELGAIPIDWEVKELGKLMENFDSKRKPLSSRQREIRRGTYPYYGATSIMDYIDDYIFDDIYVLMGEDGSVIREDGTPFLQYIWGKSWINNHAHVLKGKVFSTELLYLYLIKMNVSNIITGAVQLKINQGNMNSIKIACAPQDVYNKFDSIIQPIFSQIRQLNTENKELIKLRDILLPKLMSGAIYLDSLEIQS